MCHSADLCKSYSSNLLPIYIYIYKVSQSMTVSRVYVAYMFHTYAAYGQGENAAHCQDTHAANYLARVFVKCSVYWLKYRHSRKAACDWHGMCWNGNKQNTEMETNTSLNSQLGCKVYCLWLN